MIGSQAGMLGDASEHSRTYFMVIVKGKDIIRVAAAFQSSMGTGRPLDAPTDSQERLNDLTCLGSAPSAHRASATEKSDSKIGGTASPCSTRSATIFSARASAR
jgi:hypothetical protein